MLARCSRLPFLLVVGLFGFLQLGKQGEDVGDIDFVALDQLQLEIDLFDD